MAVRRILPALALLLAAPAILAGENGLRLVAPAEGAVVPLLNETQKAFLSMPRAERVEAYTNEAFRTRLREEGGQKPAKVRLEWKGDAGETGVFTVMLRRRPDRRLVFTAETTNHFADVGNLEIARDYEWSVRRGGKGARTLLAGDKGFSLGARGSFRTEDLAPRLIDGGDVPNVRDLGGRVGLGGRRVRQGLVFRSAGLNYNASDVFYTREELLAASDDPAALLAREAALSNELARVRSMRESSAALDLVSAEIPRRWALFRPEQAAFDADGEAALASLREIPDEFCGAPRDKVSRNDEGNWYIHGRGSAKGPAVLFAEIDASGDGWLSLGCGADWYWTLRVNGELAFDRAGGNEKTPIGDGNYAFPVRVRKGPNLLAVVLRPGSGGWRWCCKASPPVPVATLLETLEANAQYRIDQIFHVLKCRKPGDSRINLENCDLWLKELGIRTDVDLRSDGEVYGMEGSPLGPTVAWVNVSSSAYAGMQDRHGREAFAKVFRVFLDPANYPIDFHCIAGQDRTGAVAFILNALLGVDEEELWLDWEATAFHNRSTYFNHEKLFDKLVAGFDRWPGDTINERVEAYVLDLGFTPGDIAKFRETMLEPAP